MLAYPQKDIIPMALQVLNMIVAGYACNAFKYLVQIKCPDIRNYVGTDELDTASLELLLSATDQPLKSACNSLKAIHSTALSLTNMYGLQERRQQSPLTERAIQLYEQIIIDDFPTDDALLNPDANAYHTFLASFSTSAIELIGCLCRLIAQGKIDLETIWEPDNNVMDFVDEDYSQHPDFLALDQLQRLGYYLCNQLQISNS
jgi:hypothetical protein